MWGIILIGILLSISAAFVQLGHRYEIFGWHATNEYLISTQHHNVWSLSNCTGLALYDINPLFIPKCKHLISASTVDANYKHCLSDADETICKCKYHDTSYIVTNRGCTILNQTIITQQNVHLCTTPTDINKCSTDYITEKSTIKTVHYFENGKNNYIIKENISKRFYLVSLFCIIVGSLLSIWGILIGVTHHYSTPQ